MRTSNKQWLAWHGQPVYIHYISHWDLNHGPPKLKACVQLGIQILGWPLTGWIIWVPTKYAISSKYQTFYKSIIQIPTIIQFLGFFKVCELNWMCTVLCLSNPLFLWNFLGQFKHWYTAGSTSALSSTSWPVSRISPLTSAPTTTSSSSSSMLSSEKKWSKLSAIQNRSFFNVSVGSC